MIELPESPAPNGMEPRYIDRGSVQSGAASLRIDRPGSHWGMNISFPPMKPDVSRVFTARLVRGKSAGVRIVLPLLVHQGLPGSPAVDGAGQSGLVVNVRGLTPHYIVREGYWLTIHRAATSTAFLHQAFGTAVADASGKAAIELNPGLRAPFADGDTVELSAPWIEGFVQGEDWSWQIPVNKLIALSVPVEEYR